MPANRQIEYSPLNQDMLTTLRYNLQNIRLLIIDEVSMVGCNMFNFINLRLQELMGCKEPCGNISLLLVGDLFQLRPVMDRWIFQPSPGSYEGLTPNLWKDHISMYELKQIMRQQEDKQFATILNNIRENKQTPEDISIIESRITVIRKGCTIRGIKNPKSLVSAQLVHSICLHITWIHLMV